LTTPLRRPPKPTTPRRIMIAFSLFLTERDAPCQKN
jgi:hypothetical protein